MPAVAALHVLYLGRETDRERAVLGSLPVRVTVAATAAGRASDDDDVDVIVAVAPVDRTALAALDKPLVLLGMAPFDDAACADAVTLPREPLSEAILDLAIRCAVSSRDSKRGAAARRAVAQRHFKAIFEASPVGIALTSVDGIVLGANPALTQLLGVEPESLVGRPASAFTDEGPHETTHRRLFSKMRGANFTMKREKRLRRSDGKTIQAEVATSMLREGDGEPIALLQTVVDVSGRYEAEARLKAEVAERARAEGEAKKAHEFLVATISHMPQGVLVVEVPTGRRILVNDRYRDLHGETASAGADAATLHDAVRLVREDGSPYPKDQLPLYRTLADGQPHAATDIWIEQRNGLRTPVAARSAPIPYRGMPAAILTVQDITEIKEQERARRAAEALYRRLFEHATDAILIVTPDDFKIVEANPAAERLLGRDRAELAGATATSLSAGPAESTVQADFRAQRDVARAHGVAQFAWRAARKNGGPVDFEVALQPLPVEGSTEVLLLRARDVTRQRVLEDELRQSQKLEAIGLLAGGVAHDYNNILTGVIGFLELALEKLPQEPRLERVRKFVTEARRAANRSVELTRQLLTFSRRSPGSPALMDLNESVERAATMVQRLVGEPVKIEVSLAREGCPVHGDAGQLEQVLMNLAINARDAMPRGGTLKISTERYVADPAGARILDLAPGDYSTLVIADSGAGMSDSVKSRIFEPFFTTKEIGRGTGLGLAVVHGIVQRHGGRIFVDSTPGQGTRFTIVLPTVAGVAVGKRAGDSGARGAPPRGTGSILVVDDDPMVREVTAAMLETLGYRVSKAASAAEALQVVERECLDMVVSDVVMPDTNGVELERRLRRERPQLKVLLVSGYARDAFERQGVGESDAVLLKKPLTLESLGNRVREVLGRD